MEKQTRTILLVEGKREWRDLVSQVIQRCGYEVVQIDELERIHNAITARPDLILLDLDLLGERAESVVIELRSDLTMRHIPILCQGTYGNSYKIRIISAGAREVLYKPFDLSDLPSILRNNLPQ
jgi:DNA-binding response OmpR family regulator